MSALIARIEPSQRAEDLRPGLAARLLDPLWLLGRQWMLGEFDGEDAGTPVSVAYTLAHYPIALLCGSDGKIPVDGGSPLERHVEAVMDPESGWNVRRRIDAAALLARMLHDDGLDDAAQSLPTDYPLGAEGWPADAGLPPRFAADGEALFEAVRTGAQSDALRKPAADAVIRRWLALVEETMPGTVGTWHPPRLEYVAELECEGLNASLRIRSHRGGGLGWASVDLDGVPAAPAAHSDTLQRTPTALRFRGMPQARYWECEDATIDLGAVDAPAAELGRTAMLQMAMVYGNDVFLAPASVPLGSLAGVTSLQVSDTFGDVVGSTTLAPATRSGAVSGRGWALWAPEFNGAPQPWLFFPPALASPLMGDAVEEALLARDEMANRVWAIAQSLTGDDGRRRAPVPTTPAAAATATDAEYRYRLATDVPAGWSPLVLEVNANGRRLRRGPDTDVPLTRLLPSDGWIHDEEVGRDGVRLRIEYVYARGSDGSTATWARIRRSSGRGGVASGLRYDQATPIPGE